MGSLQEQEFEVSNLVLSFSVIFACPGFHSSDPGILPPLCVCVEGRPREKWMTVRKKPSDKAEDHLLLQSSLNLPA